VRRRPAAAVAALIAAAALAGCGFRSEPTSDRAERFPATVVDDVGTGLVVARQPRLIVSLDPGATATLRALGVGPRVRALGSVSTGLATLGPDLVIAPLGADAAALGSATKAPVFVYGAADLSTTAGAIARLGLAVGRGPEGIALARTVGAAVDRELARALSAPKVRVLLAGSGLQALGPQTPLGVVLAALGGVDVFAQSTFATFAAIRRADPQVILLTPSSSLTLADLRRNTITRRVTAVRTGRVYPLATASWSPSPALPNAIGRLVSLLHPGA
jgi:ABC-type Fe3+-hydroxamate transport system substrate-binding protein